jgi:hypothetical protein
MQADANCRWSNSMSRFDTYHNDFPDARLTRSKSGVLEVALHTAGGTLVFDRHTHEQFVDLFHAIGSDPHSVGCDLALEGISAADVARR